MVDRRLLAYEPTARSRLAAAVLAGLLAAVMVVGAAYALSFIVAEAFLEGGTLDDLWPVLVVLAALAVGRAVLVFAQEVLAQRAADRLKRRLRDDLTGHLLELGPVYASGERRGELAGVLSDGLETIEAWMTSYQPARLLAVIVPILVLVVVLALDPPTTLVLVFTGPILVLLLAVIGSRARAITDRRFRELRWMSAFFLDLLRGLATLKMFGRSEEQVGNLRDISRRYGETTMEVLRTAFQTSLVLEWGGAVAMALVAVEVSLRLMSGDITFERALAVLVITPEFFLPLRQLALRYHAGSAGKAAGERIFAILDMPAARPARRTIAAPPVAPQSARQADLLFEGVSFTYPDRDRPAVHDLDLIIPAGARIALVGESGAGKSTVVGLVLRFIEPTEGRLSIGGEAAADIDPAAWRAGVSWVPQSPHLFHGTIAENLRLARPEASDEALRQAASAANAAAFIEALPGGYDAPVGEGGSLLSGGERQRLAIARAFLRDAPLVILDEPTAHLDRDNEAAIGEAIERLADRRTVLVVSHRLRLARTADLVAVLDAGRLVEVGRPAELLAAGGEYARLVAVHDAGEVAA